MPGYSSVSSRPHSRNLPEVIMSFKAASSHRNCKHLDRSLSVFGGSHYPICGAKTSPWPFCVGREKRAVSLEELIVSTLAMTHALTKPLMEKGVITDAEFKQKLLEERAVYQRILNPTVQ